ncbi:transmembrane protein 207 isoform X1 [Chamaea fasciata]|uniref:transmembrane protein 207 isoform X1 n=1 Tax=Chamaea fasciata TaxID=190680 RepID=UPI00336A3D75
MSLGRFMLQGQFFLARGKSREQKQELVGEIKGKLLQSGEEDASSPSALPDVVSHPGTSLERRCVGQSDENLSSWYVWFLVLFFLALLLSCGICCCLQCCLKRRSVLPRRTVAVFALSSSDAFCATEASPCPFSGPLSPCMTAEISSSPAPRCSLGGTELPPSYEDVMKENKL